MKNPFKKLNSRGVAHHALIAFLVVAGVAGFGAYYVFKSSAATNLAKYSVPVTEETGCKLAGRDWNEDKTRGREEASDSKCAPDCRAKDAEFVKKDGKRPAYCKGYIATEVEKARCVSELHRYYVDNLGCARKANQVSANDAKVCQDEYPNYLADNKVDRCSVDEVVAKGNTANGNGSNNPANSPGKPKNPQNTPTQTSTTPAASEPGSLIDCELLGRRWDNAKSLCRPSCQANGGTLLADSVTGIKYCQNAIQQVGETGEGRCAKLHRKWTAVGCARRIDQKDMMYAIQCVEGYPYYNANFKLKDEKLTTDVCEVDKKTALANEASGTLAGTPAGTPRDDTPGGGGQGDGNGNTTFKIVLYQDKDFKGKSLTVTAETPTLEKGWNNKVSSYKIVSGRWQLCMDADFKTNCIRPYASDPELGSKKQISTASDLSKVMEPEKTGLDNNISSLRPALTKELTDAPDDVVPYCKVKDGTVIALSADGKCAKGTKLTCPTEYVLNRGECKLPVLKPDTIVPVDKSFKGKAGERACKLLGREWIQQVKGKKLNGGDYGCSMRTCANMKDGAPRLKRDTKEGYYCVSYKFDSPYAVRLAESDKESKKACDERHRVWIDQVGMCAQIPNRKDKDQTIVKAEQCSKKHTVYYIYKATNKLDACFTPGYMQRAQGVIKDVGGSLASALRQGPKAYCGTVKSGNYHWDGKHCVIDRKTCWNGNSIPVTSKCPPMPAPPSGGSGGDTGDTGGGGSGGGDTGDTGGGGGGGGGNSAPNICDKDPRQCDGSGGSGGSGSGGSGCSSDTSCGGQPSGGVCLVYSYLEQHCVKWAY